MNAPTLSTQNSKFEMIESIKHGCDIAGQSYPKNLSKMHKQQLLRVAGWVDQQVLKSL